MLPTVPSSLQCIHFSLHANSSPVQEGIPTVLDLAHVCTYVHRDTQGNAASLAMIWAVSVLGVFTVHRYVGAI